MRPTQIRDFKMKKMFLSFGLLLVVSITSTFAQDIIILKNGNDIQAIVLEIGADDVKYKKFDNPNGPSYTLRKSEIFTIRYENGSKDVFNEVVAPIPTTPPTPTPPTPPTPPTQTAINPYNSNVNSQQQFPVLKYSFGNQISPYGAEKSPFLAGFLSFLIPGVGQFYNGDVGAGFMYLGGNIILNSIWMNAEDETVFTLGLLAALVWNISSISNAAQIAKRVNIARGYRLADNTYLKIQPTIIQQNNLLTGKDYAYGMNICLNF